MRRLGTLAFVGGCCAIASCDGGSDDAVMKEALGASVACNLLQNGSFESGLSRWNFLVRGGASATQAQTTATHEDGAYSELVDVRTDTPAVPWNVQLQQSGVPLTSGLPVTVSFWAKASAVRNIEIGVQQNRSPWTGYAVRTFSVGTGWAQYSLTFTPNVSDPDALFDFDFAGAAGSMWVDGVSITGVQCGDAGAVDASPDSGRTSDSGTRGDSGTGGSSGTGGDSGTAGDSGVGGGSDSGHGVDLFVRRNGASFTLGGNPYRFGGADAFYLPWASPTELENALTDAVGMNLKVLRVFLSLQIGTPPGTGSDTNWNVNGWGPTAVGGGSEGIYFQYWDSATATVGINVGATGLSHFDKVMASAATHGLKLLVVLVDNWQFMGGTPQYCRWFGLAPTVLSGNSYCPQFYTQTNMKNAYKAWVSNVVNRTNTVNGVVYKDDPTIFAWETANEPDTNDTDFINWSTEMSAFVKSLDPNHLVSTGDAGFVGISGTGASRFGATLAIPDVDFGTLHMYAEYYQPSNTISGCTTGLINFMNQAYAAQKPSVLEEFGRTASDADQPTTLQTWASTVRAGHGSGWAFWALSTRSDRTNPPGQFMAYSPWGIMHDGGQTDQNLSAEAALIGN